MEPEVYKALYAYGPVLYVTYICSLFLESATPLLQLRTGCIFIWFWAYFIHRLYHILPSTGIFRYINIHLSLHHDHEKVLPRPLELVLETFQNAIWFGILYVLQELTDIHIVPTSIIVFALLVYSSVHIINYSVFGSEKHRQQHLLPNVNFGPDFLDHIFGTNSDPEFENMAHFIPNCILSCLAIKYWRL
jgi:hypothetical protein